MEAGAPAFPVCWRDGVPSEDAAAAGEGPEVRLHPTTGSKGDLEGREAEEES